VAYIADGQTVAPESDKERKKTRYRLKATVFLGTKKRGDGDNFWKCIGDGLKEAGVIHSDAAVDEWIMIIDRSERDNPRTEIEVERI
jgi:Holliday junction resolvase RusA-like endonuclease